MTETEVRELVRYVDVGEIAELLGVSKSWVYTRTANKTIPHQKMGHYVKFRKGEVIAWVQGGCQGS